MERMGVSRGERAGGRAEDRGARGELVRSAFDLLDGVFRPALFAEREPRLAALVCDA